MTSTTTTTKSNSAKSAPRAKRAPKTVVGASFTVPAPIDQAWKTATEKIESVATGTREAAATVEQKVKSAAASARKTGREFRKDPKTFVNTVASQVVKDGKEMGKTFTTKAEKVKTNVSREANRIADDVTMKVTTAVETAVEKTLHRFNVPTSSELKTLSQKVDALGRKIDALAKARAPRTARAAAR